MFFGYVDTAINTNAYKEKPNTNLLEFINKQESFKEKIAAFRSWIALGRILNEKRPSLQVVCENYYCGGENPDIEQSAINELKKGCSQSFWKKRKLDVLPIM